LNSFRFNDARLNPAERRRKHLIADWLSSVLVGLALVFLPAVYPTHFAYTLKEQLSAQTCPSFQKHCDSTATARDSGRTPSESGKPCPKKNSQGKTCPVCFKIGDFHGFDVVASLEPRKTEFLVSVFELFNVFNEFSQPLHPSSRGPPVLQASLY
jgi:hypothetical protein